MEYVIDLLTMLPFALAFFYLISKVDKMYEDSDFLIEKVKRKAKGQEWDRKEF